MKQSKPSGPEVLAPRAEETLSKAGSGALNAGQRAPALRVLGIDPGLASTGWGILEVSGSRLIHRGHGCIQTQAGQEMGARLDCIALGIEDIIREWKPSFAGMEGLFFSKNVSSALPVAEARGAIRLVCQRSGLLLADYSPNAIKLAVVGSSRADKAQVQAMVKLLLGLSQLPKPDHASDALAAAICLWHTREGLQLLLSTDSGVARKKTKPVS